MTLTETLSCLRDLHAYWCASNLPSEKLAALEAACLIETRSEPVPSVRLTPTGERCKGIAQAHHAENAAPRKTSGKALNARHKRHVTPARPLV